MNVTLSLLALMLCVTCFALMDLKKTIMVVMSVSVMNVTTKCVECIVNMALNLTTMAVR